jgi:hypothetical protein
MAKFVLTDASIVVNAQDLSSNCESVTVNMSQPEQDVSAMGDQGHTIVPGLPDCSFDVTWRQDYAATKVDATNWTAYGMPSFTVVVKPTSAVVGTANPTFTGTCILTDYKPISGSIGDAADATTTYTVSGTIVRATS